VSRDREGVETDGVPPGQRPVLGVFAPLDRGGGGLSKKACGRYLPVLWRTRDGFDVETVSRGGVVISGTATLAEVDGSDGFRILDGPDSSKLIHSMDELWEPDCQLYLIAKKDR